MSDLAIRASVCVVPAMLPATEEGAKARLPSAAPYYVAEYVPGERLVLVRNRFYRGGRPHHVTRFVADLNTDAGAVIDRVKSGDVEFGSVPGASWDPVRKRLDAARWHQQVAVLRPGELPAHVRRQHQPAALPEQRPAAAGGQLAVDRRALIREFGPAVGTPTDQYMPPIFPGYREKRIYPLRGPDIPTARRLANGRTRSGKAVLYTCGNPTCVAQVQILERNLRVVGLQLETVRFPSGQLLFEKLATDRGGFDIGWIG